MSRLVLFQGAAIILVIDVILRDKHSELCAAEKH